MSDPRDVEAVASGMPYVVAMVNDRLPERLDDFVVDGVTKVEAASHHQSVTLQGTGRLEADCVVFHEKDHGGAGKDVRVWRIVIRDGRFEAVERPMI